MVISTIAQSNQRLTNKSCNRAERLVARSSTCNVGLNLAGRAGITHMDFTFSKVNDESTCFWAILRGVSSEGRFSGLH